MCVLSWYDPTLFFGKREVASKPKVVLAVKKVLTAQTFVNLPNFETERDTSEKHEIKLLNLQEIYQFDLIFFLSYLVSFQSRFKVTKA